MSHNSDYEQTCTWSEVFLISYFLFWPAFIWGFLGTRVRRFSKFYRKKSDLCSCLATRSSSNSFNRFTCCSCFWQFQTFNERIHHMFTRILNLQKYDFFFTTLFLEGCKVSLSVIINCYIGIFKRNRKLLCTLQKKNLIS